jgi:uncharacterized protein YlzI (FlbEa/FlbD family)
LIPVSCVDICLPDETCGFNGKCIPYPKKHSVGTITITGLSVPVKMKPQGQKGSQRYTFIDLKAPPASPGTSVTAYATGDKNDFAGFKLNAKAVEYMEVLPEDQHITLKKGQPVVVKWKTGASGARIMFNIMIDQHGMSTKLHLVCETKDTGTYTVPAELISKLIEGGTTGYPSIKIRRRIVEHMKSKDVKNGCIEFEVFSLVAFAVDVEGHIACKNDRQCPQDMTCDKQIETCVSTI